MERLSADFGVPHPHQYLYTRLIQVKPFQRSLAIQPLAGGPGFNQFILSALADKAIRGVLNRLIRGSLAEWWKIFASHFEDWPAVLRAMRETGDDFRQGKIAVMPASGVTGN